MNKSVFIMLMFLAVPGIRAQVISERDYAFEDVTKLGGDCWVVSSWKQDSILYEKYDQYGTLHASYKDAHHTYYPHSLTYYRGHIYSVIKGAGSRYFFKVLDETLSRMVSYELDPGFEYSTTGDNLLIRNGVVNTLVKDKATGYMYLARMDLAGQLLSKQLLDTLACYVLSSAALFASGDRIVIPSNCYRGKSHIIDPDGSCRGFPLSCGSFSAVLQEQDGTLYAVVNRLTSYSCYTFSLNGNLADSFEVAMPEELADNYSRANRKNTFIPAGAGRFVLVDEAGGGSRHRQTYLVHLDFPGRSAGFSVFRDDSAFYLKVLSFNGQWVNVWRKKVNNHPLASESGRTFIRFARFPATCSGTSYPNPSRAGFTIYSECLYGVISAELTVTDMAGKAVLRENVPVSASRITIPFPLAAGVYVLHVRSGSGQFRLRHVIGGEAF